MTLFISYSRRDADAVQVFVQHLREAGHDPFLDTNLSGGQAWWTEILGRIRDCEVFIVALSQNALDSEPCQFELDYARALDLPVVPVQIGDVDSYRLDRIFTQQVIDYRNATVTTGFALINALRNSAALRRPLPDPLPDPPQIPYGYLIDIGDSIRGSEPISHRDQGYHVQRLRQAFRNETDEVVREDIRRLLRVLRNRPETSHMIVGEIDLLLVDLPGQAGWYADPSGSSAQRYFDGSLWTDHVDSETAGEVPTPGTVVAQPLTAPLGSGQPRVAPDSGGAAPSADEQPASDRRLPVESLESARPPDPTVRQAPETNLLVAILSTLFCCFPIGILAIVNAVRVSQLWRNGQDDAARAAAAKAKKYAFWSVLAAIAFWVIFSVTMLVTNGSSS